MEIFLSLTLLLASRELDAPLAQCWEDLQLRSPSPRAVEAGACPPGCKRDGHRPPPPLLAWRPFCDERPPSQTDLLLSALLLSCFLLVRWKKGCRRERNIACVSGTKRL